MRATPEETSETDSGTGGVLSDGCRLALGTLTVIPVPPPRAVGPRVGGAAMLLAPLTAVPVALALIVGAWLLSWTAAPPLLVAALFVAGLAVSTRGMHLDGLADLADGLSASFDPARSLAVMKRSDTGPSGVAAILFALLVQAAALSALVTTAGGLAAGAVGVIASRQVLGWACRRGMPAATPGGLGSAVAGTVHPLAAALSTLLLVGVAAGVGLAAGAPLAPLGAVGGATLGAVVVLARARRRLGGITGDVLGATIEVSLACALTVAALF